MKPLFTFLLAAALSFAARPATTQPPNPPTTQSQVIHRRLPNGLRVLVRPRRTAPVVTTMMWYRVGARDEVPGATGIAHFLEHLMFKGTRRLPKGAVDRITYQNGGTNNAFTSYDYTAYEFSFPKAVWTKGLEIEADRMRGCVFHAKEFESERQVVMEERRGGQDDPEQQFGEQLNAMAYLVHPYRNPVIGWMEDLKRLTRDEVYAFYRRYYVPANATLVITGDLTAEEALRAARAAFAAVPPLPAPRRPAWTEPPRMGARRLRLPLPTQVSRLEVLFPGPARGSAEVYPLEVLAFALGEGKLSRLYDRLVERDAAAAEVDAGVDAQRDSGQISLSANARPGVPLEKLEAGLWEELERLGREPLSPRELERAKNQYAAGWIQGVDTASDLATVLGEADALGDYRRVETLLDRIRRVSAEDVRRVAAAYLSRERAVVGHLVPREQPSQRGQRSGREAEILHFVQDDKKGGVQGDGLEAGDWPAGTTRQPGRRQACQGCHPERSEGSLPRGQMPHAVRHYGLGLATRLAFRTPRTRTRTRTNRTAGPRNPTPNTQHSTPFRSLTPTERLLPNGMRLVLLENHDLPSVTISLRVRAGAFDEPDARAGLANMVARMLDQGTVSRSYRDVNEELEQVGASLWAAAGGSATDVHLQALSPHVAALLPLLAELVRSPSFPEARLEQERGRLLVELKEARDDAATVAREAFDELVYGTHPAHRPVSGTEATVGGIDRAALAAFHGRFYRPGGATLVAVGDFRTADLLERLASLFEDWSPVGAERVRLPPVRRQTDTRTRRIVMEKSQAQIVLGHLGVTRNDPDYLALRVMDTILGEGVGGGFTARIPYQVRDVQGLAYTVGSTITAGAGLEPGTFEAALGTEPSRERAAVAAVVREIRRIRSEPVSEGELREATAYLANSYVFDFQTNGQIAGYLLGVLHYGLGYNYRQQFVRDVRRVSRGDVLRVARRHLDPDHLTLVVAGPAPAKPESKGER